MEKQLVIVVHGVGVKEAGVSADLLATALDDTPEANETLTRREVKAERMRPHSTDDFNLREKAEYNSGGLRQVFPARIRRYRRTDDASGNIEHERVIADFYWGDISNIASGLPGLLLGLWKTILGLSHIIRENAFSVFPDNSGSDWAMRRLAALAALTIHGPIAAINFLLLIGVFINLGFGKFQLDNSPWAIWTTVLFCVAVGLYFSRSSQVFLTRLLGGWLAVSGLVFLLIWQFLPENGIGLAVIGGVSDETIISQTCVGTKDLQACKTQATGLILQGLRMISIMGYLFIVVIFAGVILGVAEFHRYYKDRHKTPPSIVTPTIALMVLLWILVIGATWSILSTSITGLLPNHIPLQGILGTLVYCIIGLVFIAFGALYAFLRTKIWAKSFEISSYVNPSDERVARNLGDMNRMITSPYITWPLRGFLAVLALFAAFATANLYKKAVPGDELGIFLIGFAESNFAGYVLVLTAIGGFAIAAGQSALRASLGIAIDVITWLNDHSWDSAERGKTGTKTLFERALPPLFSSNSAQKTQGFWRRERIKQRFDVLATQLIRDERPNRLIIVSHSQGTVVAIDVLNCEGKRYLSMMPEGGTIALATMGSPYTHVHRHYFPRAFPSITDMPNLARRENGGILSKWINIFRIDDFVGTHIDPTGQWPQEQPVPANGHTYYWVDENVFPHLREFVK